MKVKTKIKKSEKEYYALEFLKTLKDSDGYKPHKKGEIMYITSDVEKKMMNELVKTGRTGFYCGHDFMSLSAKEVKIRKFKVNITTVTKTQEMKCDKKIKK